jgi:hypothetical protein
MGCDIHAVLERRKTPRTLLTKPDDWFNYQWINKGELDIGRDYRLFALLANVRNYLDVKPIAEPKLNTKGDDDYERYRLGDFKNSFSEITANYMRGYGSDGHSHSYLTLAEILSADFDQEVEWDAGFDKKRKGPYREGADFEEYDKIVAVLQELKEQSSPTTKCAWYFSSTTDVWELSATAKSR